MSLSLDCRLLSSVARSVSDTQGLLTRGTEPETQGKGISRIELRGTGVFGPADRARCPVHTLHSCIPCAGLGSRWAIRIGQSPCLVSIALQEQDHQTGRS